ncbi:MAG: hypothetical protein FJY75_00310 [Candidatus Eisenbacteria bacterium]|uniref:PorV/PorQ family protein n=1 Tax=Eiseniibacteriota bacterium TaxID=2212470 RepID=A0A937X907_UNCEI|nr:hypothetical protein [Candidatus Eisenbacteria bacterium]
MSSSARSSGLPGGPIGVLLAALLLAGLCARPCPAGEGGGGIAGAFAEVGPGARGAALAGALAPCVDDATAVYWNAARLVDLDAPAAAVGYADLFGLGLARHTTLHFAFPLRGRSVSWEAGRFRAAPGASRGALGVGLQTTRIDLDPEAYAEYDLAVAYARRGPWGLAWGATGRALAVRADLTGVGATGYAGDLALGRALGDRASVALVLRSLISRLAWDNGTSESLRPTAQLAGALAPAARWTLPAALLWDIDAGRLLQAALGIEWGPLGETIRLRGGLRWRDDGESALLAGALGAGLRWQELRFDYALALEREALGDTHRFSVGYSF